MTYPTLSLENVLCICFPLPGEAYANIVQKYVCCTLSVYLLFFFPQVTIVLLFRTPNLANKMRKKLMTKIRTSCTFHGECLFLDNKVQRREVY